MELEAFESEFLGDEVDQLLKLFKDFYNQYKANSEGEEEEITWPQINLTTDEIIGLVAFITGFSLEDFVGYHALMTRVEGTEANLNTLVSRIENLEADLSNHRNEYNDLKNRVAALE